MRLFTEGCPKKSRIVSIFLSVDIVVRKEMTASRPTYRTAPKSALYSSGHDMNRMAIPVKLAEISKTENVNR